MTSDNELDADAEADVDAEADCANGEGNRVAKGEGDRVANGKAKSEGDDVSCVASLDRLTAVFILPF